MFLKSGHLPGHLPNPVSWPGIGPPGPDFLGGSGSGPGEGGEEPNEQHLASRMPHEPLCTVKQYATLAWPTGCMVVALSMDRPESGSGVKMSGNVQTPAARFMTGAYIGKLNSIFELLLDQFPAQLGPGTVTYGSGSTHAAYMNEN